MPLLLPKIVRRSPPRVGITHGFLAGFLGIVAALGFDFRTDAAPAAERWLPTNTVAYVTLRDANAARLAWKSHAPGRLASDPAMVAFRTHFEAQAEQEFWNPISLLVGLQAGQLPSLAQGQVTFALVDESTGTDARLMLSHVLLVDSGSKAPELQAWLSHRDPKVPTVPISLLGFPFTEVPLAPFALEETLKRLLPDPDAPTPPPSQDLQPISFFVGQKDSLLLAGTSSNALLSILHRLQTPSAPPEAPDSVSGTATVLHGKLVVPPFLRSLSANPLSLGVLANPDGGPSLARIASALGLPQLRNASFAIRSGTEGWFVDFRLAIPAATRRGLFAMFPLPSAESGPPSFVPANSRAFTRVRFPGPDAWRGLERTLGEMDPTILGVLQLFTGYAGKTDDVDFDFQKGIIDPLGDDWMSITVPFGAPRTFGKLLLIGSPRAQELLHGLQLVASPTFLATFFPPDTAPPKRILHSVHGHPVTSIELPPMPWRDGATGAVHFASRDGYVAFSSKSETLAAFLATNPPPALATSPGFREAANHAGGTAGGYFAVADERQAAAQAFEELTRSPLALSEHLPWIAISPTTTRFITGIERWMDVSLLPPFEKVAPHFGIRITSGKSTSEGFEFTTFRPAPPTR